MVVVLWLTACQPALVPAPKPRLVHRNQERRVQIPIVSGEVTVSGVVIHPRYAFRVQNSITNPDAGELLKAQFGFEWYLVAATVVSGLDGLDWPGELPPLEDSEGRVIPCTLVVVFDFQVEEDATEKAVVFVYQVEMGSAGLTLVLPDGGGEVALP